RQGGALAHELSVSSERAGEDRLAADLDRFLELQIQGRGSDRPGQPEAGDGEGAGLEETAACSSASRCHGEPSDSEWDRDDWFSEGGKSKRVLSPRRRAPSPSVSRRRRCAVPAPAGRSPGHRGGRRAPSAAPGAMRSCFAAAEKLPASTTRTYVVIFSRTSILDHPIRNLSA